MQLCVGSIRVKNAKNILLKNIIDGCVAGIVFYFVGYGFAYGTGDDGSGNAFIGSGDFGLGATGKAGMWQDWFFQWAFAAAATTIVSGSVAERCKFEAYVLYSIFITGFLYPVVVHWYAPPNTGSSINFSVPGCKVMMICTHAGSGLVMVGFPPSTRSPFSVLVLWTLLAALSYTMSVEHLASLELQFSVPVRAVSLLKAKSPKLTVSVPIRLHLSAWEHSSFGWAGPSCTHSLTSHCFL